MVAQSVAVHDARFQEEDTSNGLMTYMLKMYVKGQQTSTDFIHTMLSVTLRHYTIHESTDVTILPSGYPIQKSIQLSPPTFLPTTFPPTPT